MYMIVVIKFIKFMSEMAKWYFCHLKPTLFADFFCKSLFVLSFPSDGDIIEYLVSQCVSLQGLITAYSTVVEWRLVGKRNIKLCFHPSLVLCRVYFQVRAIVVMKGEMASIISLSYHIDPESPKRNVNSRSERKLGSDRPGFVQEFLRKYENLQTTCSSPDLEKVGKIEIKSGKNGGLDFFPFYNN